MAIKMGTPKPKAQDKNLTISGASYSGTSFDVSSEDVNAEGLFFNPTGTKMFMVGRAPSDAVHQYTLSTGFDLSTASYDNVSFSTLTQDNDPNDIVFNSTGTKMFMVGENGSVYQYSLTTGFNLSTASYDTVSFSVFSEDSWPTGIFFNSGGTKMFMIGRNSDSVHQYTLTTGFDLSTASYDNVSFSVSSQDGEPHDIYFNSTGTRMFMVGDSNDSVYQYSLGTGFNISTASYDNISFDVSSQDNKPRDIFFNPGGTKMFLLGAQGLSEAVYEYNL